jgi:hypothetical protein
MFFKVIVVAVLAFILFNLGAGLIYLVKDQGHSDRTLKALTLRIAFSVALFILLMIGFATGLITPHSI